MRFAGAIFLLLPPSHLDGATCVALTETIACLAHEQPEVIVDLTNVDVIEDRAARLIMHLSGLTRAAGGRLLAICPSAGATAFAFHELDPDDQKAIAQIEGALGKALRRVRRTDRR